MSPQSSLSTCSQQLCGTAEKAFQATQHRFSLVRPAASPFKAPVPAAQAAISHARAASTKATAANASPASTAAEAPADIVNIAASPAAASEMGDIAAAAVSPTPAEADPLVGSALPDLLSFHMKAGNDFSAQGHNPHREVCVHRAGVVAQYNLCLGSCSTQHLLSNVGQTGVDIGRFLQKLTAW